MSLSTWLLRRTRRWNRWADRMEARYFTPWLGRPKDWHSWIYHTVFAVLFGGGTGALIGWLLPWSWATALLGYAIGSTCGALWYTWRETIDHGWAQYRVLDSRMDILGPWLNAILAWVLRA